MDQPNAPRTTRIAILRRAIISAITKGMRREQRQASMTLRNVNYFELTLAALGRRHISLKEYEFMAASDKLLMAHLYEQATRPQPKGQRDTMSNDYRNSIASMGAQAAREGNSVHKNPFNPTAEEYRVWEEGYRSWAANRGGPDEFMECDTCSKLPGTPPLCAGCRHNRAVITRLKEQVSSLGQDREYLTTIRDTIDQWQEHQ